VHFNPGTPDFNFPLEGSGMEFRMLANEVDDKAAMDEARLLLNQPDGIKAELDELQRNGLPPPAPRSAGPNKTPRQFRIFLPAAKPSQVSYSWVELGPSERAVLGLDNTAKNDPQRNATWNEAAGVRGKATHLTEGLADRLVRDKLLLGALFFSRECKNQELPEDERKKKAVDYFVLARNPEIDNEGLILPHGKAKAITGEYLLDVRSGGLERPAQPKIFFTLNDLGGKLLHELTEKNCPSNWIRRHLAILVNGLVIAAPTVNSPIASNGMITGNFSRQEVESLVNFLRGKLPGHG